MIKKLVLFLGSVWFLVLLLRSGLHLKRVLSEAGNPHTFYYPEIQPCAKNLDLSSPEKVHLFKYRQLGIECQN